MFRTICQINRRFPMNERHVSKPFPRLIAAWLMLLFLCLGARQVMADTTTIELPVQFGQTEARTMLDMINDFRTGSNA